MGRKVLVSVFLVALFVFMSSCGKDASKKAIDEAQAAINEARGSGAEQYAPEEYRSAEDYLSKAKDNYNRFSYQSAKSDALAAKDQAELAKKRALARKAQETKPAPETSTAYNVPSLGGKVSLADKDKAALKDVHFAFDSSALDEVAKQILVENSKWLKANPGVKVVIEGHCDERGTEDYNLALGERRAKAARSYLISLGVKQARMSTVSYGESIPLDPGHNESAWALNRRAHFAISK